MAPLSGAARALFCGARCPLPPAGAIMGVPHRLGPGTTCTHAAVSGMGLLLRAGWTRRKASSMLTWSRVSVCGTTKQRLTFTVPSVIVPSRVPITLSCFSPRLMYESHTCRRTTGCTLTLMFEPLMGSSNEATICRSCWSVAPLIRHRPRGRSSN